MVLAMVLVMVVVEVVAKLAIPAVDMVICLVSAKINNYNKKVNLIINR